MALQQSTRATCGSLGQGADDRRRMIVRAFRLGDDADANSAGVRRAAQVQRAMLPAFVGVGDMQPPAATPADPSLKVRAIRNVREEDYLALERFLARRHVDGASQTAAPPVPSGWTVVNIHEDTLFWRARGPSSDLASPPDPGAAGDPDT